MNLNSNQTYNGPFADIEEHRFYTVIPNLRDLVPSLYSKKGKKQKATQGSEEPQETSGETVDETPDETIDENNDETPENLEDEIEALDQRLQSVTEEEEKEEETPVAPTLDVSRHIAVADLKNLSLAEKVDILMDRLLLCYTGDDVDRWCLEFCDLNKSMTRLALIDTIRSNYRKRAHQPYFARAIRELEPAFEKLSGEVESIVMVGLRGMSHK